MERIGIRELRQNASRYVRRVAAGEVIEVTDRGKPVARLVPPQTLTVRERLIAEGKLVAAKSSEDLLNLEPLTPESGQRPLSDIVDELRQDRLP